MNTVYNTDAMSLIKGTQSESVDLVILDPDYQFWNDFIKQGLIEETMRVLKPSGNVLCFTKQPFDYELRIAVNPYFRREITWTFENGGAWVSPKMPLVSFQKIYWLVKSDDFYFNPRTGEAYSENTKEFKRSVKVFGDYCEEGQNFSKSNEGVWLRDHLHFNKPNCGDIPAKPQKLIDIFVKCFCPVGGMMLDLFSGSGICSIVARDNRVNSVGAEINIKRQKEIADKLSEPVQMNIFDFLH